MSQGTLHILLSLSYSNGVFHMHPGGTRHSLILEFLTTANRGFPRSLQVHAERQQHALVNSYLFSVFVTVTPHSVRYTIY